MHSSLSRQENTYTTTNQDFWNTPPEGHLGYPIVEEAPPTTPLQDTIHILEVTPNSPRPLFSKEHLTLIMDIHRDVADLLFRQECLNHRLDFLYDTLSGEPASNHCRYVSNLTILFQPGTNTLLEATIQTQLVLDSFGFVSMFCLRSGL
jgi:hypothetical protein